MVVSLLMSACASSVPLGDPAADAAAKRFESVPDSIKLYVVQSGGVLTQHRINFQVIIGAKLAAIMSGSTYSVHKLAPGSHTILVSSPENQEVIGIKGGGGDVLFLAVGSHGGWTQMRASDLRLLDEADGRRAVLGARLSKNIGD